MIDTTAMTDITPMTIPSSVNSDRRRFARKEESAMKIASPKFTWLYYDRFGVGGPAKLHIKEAAKRCTNYGLAGGPDANKVGILSASSSKLFLKQPDFLFHR